MNVYEYVTKKDLLSLTVCITYSQAKTYLMRIFRYSQSYEPSGLLREHKSIYYTNAATPALFISLCPPVHLAQPLLCH